MKATVAIEGIRGLWRGLGSTFYRDVPFSGIYWATYESLKLHNDITVPTFWFSFFGGATSGSVRTLFNSFNFTKLTMVFQTLLQIAAFLTAPFDVVKTHKQIEFGEKVLYADKPVKSLPKVGTLSILHKIFQQNGLHGIFAGVIPRCVKIAPACAIMITSFEHGKAFFFRHNVENFIEAKGSFS